MKVWWSLGHIQNFRSSVKKTHTINCFLKYNVHSFIFYTPYDDLWLKKQKLYVHVDAELIYKNDFVHIWWRQVILLRRKMSLTM